MISEEKMIQGMKKSLKKRKSIVILASIVIIFQTTLIIWLFHQLNKNINEIITEELQISIVDQQPTLYTRTFHASSIFTMLMFQGSVLGIIIGVIITRFFIHRPRTQLIVSIWDRLDKLEQQVQSEPKNDNIKDTD